MAEQVLEVMDTVHTFKEQKQPSKEELLALLDTLTKISAEEEISQ